MSWITLVVWVAGVGGAGAGAVGPDVTTGDLQSTRWWATDEVESAYSIGVTACNVGDQILLWEGLPLRRHGIAAQNMFRLSADGQMEQLGQSWLFHMFCALQQNLCGECDGGGGCQSVLHPQCSDPHTASRAGRQGGLGPKWPVNPHTVEFSYPWNDGEGTAGAFRRRLRVRNADIDPVLNPGARYFLEVQFIAPDDAASANGNNAASYREVTVDAETLRLSYVAPVRRERAGIHAWQDADPDVMITGLQVDADGEPDPDTGLFDDGLLLVGYRVTETGEGTWRYEYAIQNLNSHRAARVFAVPVPEEVTLTDIGFHDVGYHSGDGIDGVNFDGTDWPAVRDGDELRWETETLEANENANALRWGTLYNFRFTADTPPSEATARVAMYRPGTPESMTLTVAAPSPAACPADLDASGVVDFTDLLALLAAWGPCEGCPEDLDGSGAVDFTDVLAVLAAWGPCV